jgi:hypothetical protein
MSAVLDLARRPGQLLGAVQQRARPLVELVGPPGGRELAARVLVPGQAAHGRRVERQSGRSTEVAVDDGGEHLALQAAERRAPCSWRRLRVPLVRQASSRSGMRALKIPGR